MDVPAFPGGGYGQEGPARVDKRIPVPADVDCVRVDLMARWAPGGTVSFGNVSVTSCAPPERRTPRLAVVQGHAPSGEDTDIDTAREWAASQVEEAAQHNADLVCFGEAINFAGIGGDPVDSAEPIPEGPMSQTLSRAAAKHSMYVVAGVYEKDGDIAYNSAPLFGRQGQLIGVYRKVHLPSQEVDWGFTPGGSYPVFETELGRIGIQICYDNDFPEGARKLALEGAEIICLPIWGDSRADHKAWPWSVQGRALENGVAYVTANYSQKRSLVIDHNGNILVDSNGESGVHVADVELTDGYVDMDIERLSHIRPHSFKDVFLRERRPETYYGIDRWGR